MGRLTKWISRRTTGVSKAQVDEADEVLGGGSGAKAKVVEKEKKNKKREGKEVDVVEEESLLSPDELWFSTLSRRRHPLGFVLAPSKAYAVEPSKDTRLLAEQNSIMFKMWPVFLSVIIDLFVNAYTEPVYSTKRTVHALVFSCQVCTLLLTVTSFVVLVGGDSASTSQADYYLRLFSKNKAMLFFCGVNVLAMCSCRITKLVLLFGNYPHAEITKYVPYRFLYATHQIVSTLYYVTLVQSVFSVCKHFAITRSSSRNKV